MKALVIAAAMLTASPTYGQSSQSLALVSGAITCQDETSMRVALMPGVDPNAIESMGCSEWADGVPIELATVPSGMVRGIVAVRIHGKMQWTSLSMIRRN
ncbi:MAG: hypothetical protein ACLQJR_34585 [Stellaceae bacterium]